VPYTVSIGVLVPQKQGAGLGRLVTASSREEEAGSGAIGCLTLWNVKRIRWKVFEDPYAECDDRGSMLKHEC
jgi:hypothetical protein